METHLKQIWFGRYLGCNVAFYNKYTEDFITYDDMGKLSHVDGDVCCLKSIDYDDGYAYFEFDKCKLILKELKDISEEDLKECGFDWSDMDFAKKEFLKRFDVKTISDKESLVDFIDEVDFLRSIGYAIGIPKKYYITEKELEEMK